MSSQSPSPGIVTLVGRGEGRPNGDAELPLDINYQKLTEWLVSRRKLPADWHKRVAAIQGKAADAAKELPPGLLAGLGIPAEAPLDYFRAVAVRDKLAQAGERTLFGALSGQAGVWDKIVKAYENGSVFVGEAAGLMVQNVDYEVPYLRKAMAKCSQQMADADRRQAEYARAAAACAASYQQECAKLGIAGASVAQELRGLTAQLPGLFERLVAQLREPQLQPALDYYRTFAAYAHGPQQQAAPGAQPQQAAELQLPDVLPLLSEVREQRTAPPSQPASCAAGLADAANNAAAGGGGSSGAAAGIDWGPSEPAAAGGGPAAAGGGISWDLGDLSAAAGGDGGGISWDVAAEPPQEGGDAAGDSGGGGGEAAAAAPGPSLDWDIDVSGISVEASGKAGGGGAAGAPPRIDWGVEPGEAGAGGAAGAAESSGAGAGSGDAAAARLQADGEYRAQLLDDLQELRAFLLTRKAGLSGSSSSGDLLRALAPELVAATDAADVGRMLARVEALLAALNDAKLRQLLMISGSHRYLERLSSSLQRKAGQEAKMLAAAAETAARKQEARATLAGLQPRLREIVERTRSVKLAVEAEVSRQLNGRRVNVLGEINNALAGAS